MGMKKDALIKESNPKDRIGATKLPASFVPQTVMAEVALGMLEGGIKYGRHNYRDIGVRASIYYDAARRHLDDWWEGEDIDPDSTMSHVTKAICALVVLRDAMIFENWYDDRPPRAPKGFYKDMNAKAREIIERVTAMDDKFPLDPHTEERKKHVTDIGNVSIDSVAFHYAGLGEGDPRSGQEARGATGVTKRHLKRQE